MAAAILMTAALAGCGDGGGDGDGNVSVPWWVFWQMSNNRTEVRYVPAPGPGYRVPAQRPAPRYVSPPRPMTRTR